MVRFPIESVHLEVNVVHLSFVLFGGLRSRIFNSSRLLRLFQKAIALLITRIAYRVCYRNLPSILKKGTNELRREGGSRKRLRQCALLVRADVEGPPD